MEKTMKAIIIGLGALIALLALLVTQYEAPGPAIGGAPPGLTAGTSTSNSITVGSTSVATIFSTSRNCLNRTISTTNGNILLSFASVTPTATIGHWQGASTTVTYDAGLYGCEMWRAFGVEVNGATPSSTVTATEFR